MVDTPFNPNVAPEPEQVYFHWSHPISEVAPNKAAAYAIKTVGDVATTAVKDVDEVVTNKLERDIHRDVDQIQDEYKKALETKYAQETRTGTMTDANGLPVESLTRPDTRESAVHPDIKNLNQAVGILGEARANNKLSKTAYDGRLDALLKDYRTRYPGWRKEIDDIGTRATSSRSSANQYISSILGDINSFEQQRQSSKNKTEELLIHNYGDIPNAPILHQALRDGKMSNLEVESMIYPYIAAKAQFETDKRGLERFKMDREYQAIQAKDIYGQNVATAVSHAVDGFMVASPAGNPIKFTQLLADWSANKTKVTDDQWRGIGDQLADLKRQLKMQVLKDAAVPIDADARDQDPTKDKSKSLNTYLGGPDVAEKEFEANAKLLDGYIDAVRNQQWGTMHSQAAAIKAQQNGVLAAAMQDPKVGSYIAIMDAFKTASPAFLATLQNSALIQHLQQPDSAFIETLAARAVVQPDLRLHGPIPNMPAPNGQAFTATDAVNIANQPDTKKKLGDPKGTINRIIGLIDNIGNPNTDVGTKQGLIQFAFSSNNLNFLDHFGEDRYEGTRLVPGKYKVFNQLTTQANTKAIKELSQGPVGEQVWTQYKNWAETSFSRKLFSTELHNLSDYKEVPGVKITWDNEHHSFNAELADRPSEKMPADYYNRSRVQQVAIQKRLDFLNSGIHSMANIAEADGKDVNAYLYQLFVTSNPDAAIPKMMKQSLESSHPNKLGFAPEDQSEGGLQSFLASPGGSSRNNAPAVNSRASRGNLGEILSVGTPINIPNERTPQTERMMRGLQ